MKLLTTVKEIDAAIVSIGNRGKKLDGDIQIVGLSVINHIGKHGDVTLANRLMLCLPKGSRSRALASWLLEYGKLAVNTDRVAAKDAPFVYDKSRPFNEDVMKSAAENPWYDFAPEAPVIEMFNLTTALHRLLAQAKRIGKVNDEALLGRLLEIDAQLQAGNTVAPVSEGEAHAEGEAQTNGDAEQTKAKKQVAKA